jgi:hypothetical protein
MKRIYVLCFCFILTSCYRYNPSEETKLNSVPFTYSEKSEPFKQNEVMLQIDTGAHFLYVTLKYKLPKSTSFPINKEHNDTLTETGFLFDFMADGQPILSGYKTRGNRYGWGRFKAMENVAEAIQYKTDTVNLAKEESVSVQIPFYAFYKLKKGVHTFEIKVTQTVFRSNKDIEIPYYDSTFKHISSRYVRFRANKSFINCKAKFKLNVPALLHTELYSNGIEIKNDSTFNPYTCDNTIWKSSLPDVYWAVFYPLNNYYTSSDYVPSTIEYTKLDTFSLYHYDLNDSICFAVYDHDNLSSDDGLGFKNFCIKDVIKDKGINTTFYHVKTFSVKAAHLGIANP